MYSQLDSGYHCLVPSQAPCVEVHTTNVAPTTDVIPINSDIELKEPAILNLYVAMWPLATSSNYFEIVSTVTLLDP